MTQRRLCCPLCVDSMEDRQDGVVSVLCDLTAKEIDEVHKVAEVEVVAHGYDFAVFAFTVLLFKNACTHERARGHKVLVELQPVVLIDAHLCEAVQVLHTGRRLHEITAQLLLAA